MRTLGTTVAALGALIACAGAVCAAPVPADVVGTWSPAPDCAATAPKMVFDATMVSIVQDDGRKKSVQVDTTGQSGDRLEIRVTSVAAGEADNSAGPHVGDTIVVRRENDELHLIARSDNGGPPVEVPNAPPLHRCKP